MVAAHFAPADLDILMKLSREWRHFASFPGVAALRADAGNLIDPIGFLLLERYRQSVTYRILRATTIDPDPAIAQKDARALLTILK